MIDDVSSGADGHGVTRTHRTQRFGRLFSDIHLHLHRRTLPGEYRPRPEALAVLHHRSRTGPLSITEAATHLSRSQAATSEIVNRLAARDLLMRFSDARDRRRHLVWLTDAGVELVRRESGPLDESQVTDALNLLDDDTYDALFRGMEALARAAKQTSLSRTKEDD